MMRLAALVLAVLVLGNGAWARAAESRPLPDEVSLNGVEFVRIPAGYFWYIVATDYPNRRPFGSAPYREVRVWLDEYYLAKYEARAKDFVRFMNSPAARSDFVADPHYWLPEVDGCAVFYDPGAGFRERFAGADLPATAVSWELADEFARWMGFRLPTEAEWQKAARGTDRRIWPWGNEYPDETFANYMVSGHCAPAPVTAYPKGRSPYGVYNMAGNVVEATANWLNLDFDKSIVNGARNPVPPSEPAVNDDVVYATKIVKGGRWPTIGGSITIAMRELSQPNNSNSSSGLRFAVNASVVRMRLQEGSATVIREQRESR